ncbi:MAG: hypothetical protein ACRDDY_10775 [Clostridium sp.]|uniref:hypothetical protein n=1 Tax=Clostridium sp. TaxID=1506 RepID=UPI003EE790A6
MNCDKVNLVTKYIVDIERETGGKFFLGVEEDSCVAGVIVRGLNYNRDKVHKKLGTLMRKLKLKNYKHVMVGDNIILIQFTE